MRRNKDIEPGRTGRGGTELHGVSPGHTGPADSHYDERLVACPVCEGDRLAPFDRDFRGNTITRCVDCGLRFMNPQYSDAYLEGLYAGYTFNSHRESAEHLSNHRCRPAIRAESKRRALKLVARYVEPSRLLMLGCGDGLEIRVAKELGWRVTGFEPDPVTAARVAAQFDVPVLSGSIGGADLAHRRFQAVFMDQVIEHLKDPASCLRDVRALLRPGGVLFLGAPNIASFSNTAKTIIDRLGLREHKRGKHYATQHHLFYFTPRTLRRMLERRFGYEVLDVRGSLKPQKRRWSLTPLLSRWVPNFDSGLIVVARRPEDRSPSPCG